MAFSAADLEIAQGYLAQMIRTREDEERLAALVASLRGTTAGAATLDRAPTCDAGHSKPKKAAKKKARKRKPPAVINMGPQAADTLPPDAPEGAPV
jgi:hypothetical protein|tara:strand:+ start:1454 stop:1741 length:288 start_codon:yes stop_codon:yes gene_type:complete